jgi:glycerol-3-phosphate acyltransferase PlsY
MTDIAVVASGYVIGSLPLTFLLVRWRGVDLRRTGSGNVGAANVLRTCGAATAVVAVCVDVAKGAAAVLVAQVAGGSSTPVLAGGAAIAGHIFPVWLGFRGGKGVATAAGVFSVLAPLAAAVAGVVFCAVVFSTRYVSAGSMAGAGTLVTAVIVLGAPTPVVVGAVAAALMVLYGHRGNLGRLYAGTERRIWDRS